MIDFPCQCGFRFSVPQDTAGTSLQCPKCHRLVDVPMLGDLPSIKADGTYEMDAPPPPNPQRLAETFRAFNRNSRNFDGTEKDLRPNINDVLRTGDHPPAANAPARPRAAPKYDPVTGQLIREIEIIGPAPVPAASIPYAKPALGYATMGMQPRIGPARVFLELFTPPNAMVMAFIFLFHIALHVLELIALLMFPIIAAIILIFALIAHYGCVIDEIGREEKDELPRPLRQVNFADDFWWPFCNAVAAFILCYAPPFIAPRFVHDPWMARFTLVSFFVLGTILFPAVWLTLQTSGSIMNLRADRLLGTIRLCGPRYVFLVILWLVAAIVYALGVEGLSISTFVAMLQMSGRVSKFVWAITLFLLMLGIYLMHAFCWQLGLIYRAKHTYFPWVMQRHEHVSSRERMALNDAGRAVLNARRAANARGANRKG
jgi:hypothetical protein